MTDDRLPTGWVDETLAALTLEEKLRLLAGRDVWHTAGVERLGIPVVKLVDGPNGARGADGNHGPTSTSFPVGAAMGATWDPELVNEVGRALGREAEAKGASVLLGPTVNIPRVPNAGRNFECFSEDPLLSGLLAAAYVEGVQSEGVAACIKHFVCNDQETDRYSIDAVVDERTLREVYLEPFRIAVERAHPWAVMSAYNRVNGVTCSEHPLLDDVLRDEFGFDGLVVSDWYGTYGPGVAASGLDLEMPGPGRWLGPASVRDALESGSASPEEVDRKVRRLLTLIERTGATQRSLAERAEERPADRALVRRVATEATVLLRNDGLLPLTDPARVAVIGDLAARTPHQGGGSSSVNAHRVVSILDGLVAALPDAEITHEVGTSIRRGTPGLDPAALVGDGIVYEYVAHAEPAGEPVRTVVSDRTYLNFFGTRDEWVDFSDFAIRAGLRYRAPATGTHRFEFGAAGRLRVTIDGAEVVTAWDDPSDGHHPVEVDLAAGREVDIRVEFAAVDDGRTWRFLSLACAPPGPEPNLGRATDLARDADVAIVVVGRDLEWEAEGWDRPDLVLPGAQDDLVSAVAAAQPNTIVVVTAGSPIEMPWADEVAAIVLPWFGGQEVGHAVADVLLGHADPGGRLPVTFPATSSQHPGLLNFPGEAGRVRYGEGVHVGHRAYDKLGIEPRFRFGHGLSYTTFAPGAVAARRLPDGGIAVDLTVTNTGGRDGSELVRIDALGLGGVARRLVGFRKAAVDADAQLATTIAVPAEHLRTWDPVGHGWSVADGPLRLSVSGTGWERTVAVPEAASTH